MLIINKLTFLWLVLETAAGTKKFVCVDNCVGIVGAKMGVSFFEVDPDGLNTSTYDFLSAIQERKKERERNKKKHGSNSKTVSHSYK